MLHFTGLFLPADEVPYVILLQSIYLSLTNCVCLCIGYPAPKMRWYHIFKTQSGLTPVIDDDKHFIHQLLSHGQVLSIDEVWYQMTIINVQANDYGIYICEGTNKLGTDRVEIKIYG